MPLTLTITADSASEFRQLLDAFTPTFIHAKGDASATQNTDAATAPGEDADGPQRRPRRTKAQIEADAAAAAGTANGSSASSSDAPTEPLTSTSPAAAAAEKPAVEFTNAEPAEAEVTPALLKEKLTVALSLPKAGGVQKIGEELKRIAGTMSVSAMAAEHYPAVNAALDEIIAKAKA